MIPPSFLINIPMMRLDIIGLSPRNTKKNIIVRKIIMFIFTIQLVMIILYCSTANYDSMETRLSDLIASIGFYQIYYRIVKTIQKKNEICEMVDIINEKFWPTDFLEKNEYTQIQKLYKYILLFQTSYNIMTLFASIGSILSSIAARGFVDNFWPISLNEMVKIPPYFQIIWIIQSVYVFTGVYALVQQDMLFFIFAGVTLIELIKLKRKLAIIGTDRINKKDEIITKECIDYHNLLLSILTELEDMYSGILLQIFGTNFVCTVVCLFGIKTDIALPKKIFFVGMLMFAAFQFFMYCLLGQIIEDQSSSVAEAAYNCKWEEITNLNIKKALILCIQRAQKPMNITMGRLVILNLFTFKQVVQMVFSVLTLFLQTNE